VSTIRAWLYSKELGIVTISRWLSPIRLTRDPEEARVRSESSVSRCASPGWAVLVKGAALLNWSCASRNIGGEASTFGTPYAHSNGPPCEGHVHERGKSLKLTTRRRPAHRPANGDLADRLDFHLPLA
jgi:hypothetical protein